MKRPFDWFKQSQNSLTISRAERRRAPRWSAQVPVFVYGHATGEIPFHEEAYSVVVSDYGALLVMSTTVDVGAKLLLTNRVTETEQQCRVASVSRRPPLGIAIAVEFIAPASHFWRVTAPPQRVELGPAGETKEKAL